MGLFVVFDICFYLFGNIHFQVSNKNRRVFFDIISNYVKNRVFGLFKGDFVRFFVELTVGFEFVNVGLVGCL